MHGQWVGRFEGTNHGQVVLDLDDVESGYVGHAIAFDDNQIYPDAVIRISTNGKSEHEVVNVEEIDWLYPGSVKLIEDINEYTSFNPGLVVPKKIKIDLRLSGSSLNIIWSTDIGTQGTASLDAGSAEKSSEYTALERIENWRDFQEFALGCPPRRYIFRGQNCLNRLRTSFHRTKRKDIISFLINDIPNVHLALSARTKHIFDIQKNEQNAAFLNLLQHHGYPTPLLDWSYSPFVAAFFAYRKVLSEGSRVRIYIFDKTAWENQFNQIKFLAFARPHFSIFESLAIENLRSMPQQSVSSLTNIDDIEAYIKNREAETAKTYLRVVELPASDRRIALDQLSLMGITAGSLFPGLDGACEELAGRYFR